MDLSDDDEEIVAELEKKIKICEKSKALQTEGDLLSTLSLLEAMHRAERMVCKLKHEHHLVNMFVIMNHFFENKKLNSELERQRASARKKLEERRYKRQLKEYEDEVVNSMIAMAEKTQIALMNLNKNEKHRQKDIVRNSKLYLD